MKAKSILLFLICMISPGLSAGTLSIDGPYVFHLPDQSVRVVAVKEQGVFTDTVYRALPSDFKLPVYSDAGSHLFDVPLHPVERPAWQSPQPDKVLVMSDPHGNWDCFVSTLQMNEVIDSHYNWIFNDNHLILIGDIFDRGNDVLPLFWLIYKLEKEARDAGGQVSFLLGNHEAMVLAGDLRYLKEKYVQISEELDLSYEQFFGPDTELGRWLATRNTIQVIGDDLYVHAGLGKDFLQQDVTIPQVNEEMSRALFMNKEERKALSPLVEFLYGTYGPIWYRGMVRNDPKYDPLTPDTLRLLLEKYKIRRIIVGHTIFPDIRSLYNGRVLTVNVDNKKNFEQVLGRGILIEHTDSTYVISDKGILRQLF